MAISKEEVKKIAMLSRIEIDDSEAEELVDYFGRILGHFNRLQELNLEGINPFSTADVEKTLLREDEVRPWKDRDAVLAQAPDSQGDFFRVPSILGEED